MAELRSINALRAVRENDNSLLSPVECLDDAAEDLRLGEVKADKVLVIALNSKDGAYDIRWWSSNLLSSEMVALAEAFKMRALKNMDLI